MPIDHGLNEIWLQTSRDMWAINVLLLVSLVAVIVLLGQAIVRMVSWYMARDRTHDEELSEQERRIVGTLKEHFDVAAKAMLDDVLTAVEQHHVVAASMIRQLESRVDILIEQGHDTQFTVEQTQEQLEAARQEVAKLRAGLADVALHRPDLRSAGTH